MKTKINIKHIISSLVVTACFMAGHEVFAQASITLTSGTNYSPAAVYFSSPTSSAVAYIQHDRNPGNPDTGGLQLLARNTRPIQFFTQEVNVPFTSDSEVMRISANGSLGIGTKTPAAKLDVIGSGIFSDSLSIGTDLYVNGASQFNGAGYFGNSVGIGTNNPSAMLDVNGGGHFSGDVGIGTATPRGMLDVDGPGDIYLVDDTSNCGGQSLYIPGHIYIAPFGGSDVTYIQARRKDNSGSTQMRFRTYNSGQLMEAMHINSQGNVGVGTTSPSEKLQVSGTVKATSFVSSAASFPDYVFAEGYKITPLSELETYVKQYKHLPNMPSEKEVVEQGLNLPEVMIKSVENIETIYLHLIRMEKQIETLQQENTALKQQLKKSR